jgi:hypothetical protein
VASTELDLVLLPLQPLFIPVFFDHFITELFSGDVPISHTYSGIKAPKHFFIEPVF